MGVGHYENFPVASLLSPPRLRPAIVALYHFARTADDLADEGDAPPAQRLADLQQYRAELRAAIGPCGAAAAPARWPQVFAPLAAAHARHGFAPELLHALLDAFEQDARGTRHADRASLLAYCSRSANPVGRLLLQLHRIDDATALHESDCICSALQLINFWQDLGRDDARGRRYLPADAWPHAQPLADTPALRAAIARECAFARGLMLEGAPLVHRLPGRAGWELRLVVQGGLRVLEKIARLDHAVLHHRPVITAFDAPLLLGRACAMRAGRAGALPR